MLYMNAMTTTLYVFRQSPDYSVLLIKDELNLLWCSVILSIGLNVSFDLRAAIDILL